MARPSRSLGSLAAIVSLLAAACGSSAAGGNGGNTTTGSGGDTTTGSGGDTATGGGGSAPVFCPAGPTGDGPSLASCSDGLDPSKSGGELLWTRFVAQEGCPLTESRQLLGGPTGDAALLFDCDGAAAYQRVNGSGQRVGGLVDLPGTRTLDGRIGPHNELGRRVSLTKPADPHPVDAVRVEGPTPIQWTPAGYPKSGQTGMLSISTPMFDVLGNVYIDVETSLPDPVQLDATTTVPAGTAGYMARIDTTGVSMHPHTVTVSPTADGQGFLTLALLQNANDVGCGAISQAPGPGFVIAHLHADWSCDWQRVLPAFESQIWLAPRPGAGIAVVGSTLGPVDLGCGPPPVQSKIPYVQIAELDASGQCVKARGFGENVDLSPMTLTPQGNNVVLQIASNGESVDFGGGPLAPAGTEDVWDIAVAVLGQDWKPIWSRRFGGASTKFSDTALLPGSDHRVSVGPGGDIYLMLQYEGTIDFGGGPVTSAAQKGDLVVVRLAALSGEHVWSRSIRVRGAYDAAIDGCGALVLASRDPAFEVACGRVFPPDVDAQGVAFARFMP